MSYLAVMKAAYLTRIVPFFASLRYQRSGWNAERNRVAFGSLGSEHAHQMEDPTLYPEYRGE